MVKSTKAQAVKSAAVRKQMAMRIKLVHPDAQAPIYSTEGAGFFDIHTPTAGFMVPGGTMLVDTGIKFEVPEGYTMLVLGRSGHGFNADIRLSNCTGVIDSDFRGTLKVKLKSDGSTGMEFEQGSRIAQAALIETPYVHFLINDDDLSDTERGDGGLGSTGA